ncbi:hypothetical protein ASF61_21330 [Duganella sp. Leaf126]|nr:hypothetical protein ASF61_21330 [Duganella sp. Leaf126]
MAVVIALATALALSCAQAKAVQIVEGGDGSTLYAKLSKKEMTRLAVDHGRVASLRVREGELGIDADEETGQVFLTVPDGASKPINGFLTTDAGNTYTLVLQIVDAPADSIIIKQPRQRSALARNDFKSGAYDKAIKRLIGVMAGDELPEDIEVTQVGRKLDLWQEASMLLETRYSSGDMVGERYVLANVSQAPMVLDEREFYRPGVHVIALDQLNLAPEASTRLYIIRRKAQHE